MQQAQKVLISLCHWSTRPVQTHGHDCVKAEHEQLVMGHEVIS